MSKFANGNYDATFAVANDVAVNCGNGDFCGSNCYGVAVVIGVENCVNCEDLFACNCSVVVELNCNALYFFSYADTGQFNVAGVFGSAIGTRTVNVVVVCGTNVVTTWVLALSGAIIGVNVGFGSNYLNATNSTVDCGGAIAVVNGRSMSSFNFSYCITTVTNAVTVAVIYVGRYYCFATN